MIQNSLVCLLLCGFLVLGACQAEGPSVVPGEKSADLQVLLIGNSHSLPIPRLLTMMFEAEQPALTTHIEVVPDIRFLAEHAEAPDTLKVLNSRNWDYVILQAQKYSTSGKYHYPYDGALKLTQLAQEQGAKVIMYPEWSREGHWDEFYRIEKIHNEIAEQTGAQVAPVGSLWQQAREAHPDLPLYSMDGNHADDAGNYLTTAVLYRLLTEKTIVKGFEWAVPENQRKIQEVVNQYPDWPQTRTPPQENNSPPGDDKLSQTFDESVTASPEGKPSNKDKDNAPQK